MIEMKCPACGAKGRAPNDKINTRLVCRKCLQVFHLTPTGRVVLGEPPTAGLTSDATRHAVAAPDRVQEVDQWFDRVSRTLFSPMSLLIAMGLILLAAATAFLSLRRSETLQDRVTRVAEAVVHGDLQTIRSLASTGTTEDAVKWYDSVRTQCDGLRQHLSSHKLVVEVEVKRQDAEQESADVVARMDSKETLERKAGALPDPFITITTPIRQTVSLPMAWKSERWGGWRLDGKRTLEVTSVVP